MNILLSPYLNPHCIPYLNPYPSPYLSLYSNPGPRLILTNISYGGTSKYPLYFWKFRACTIVHHVIWVSHGYTVL